MTKRQIIKWLESQSEKALAEVETQSEKALNTYYAERNVIANVSNMKNAKLAMEYLKNLGFDLSELVKADENPVTTALSVEVDTRFLFIGGKKNEVE